MMRMSFFRNKLIVCEAALITKYTIVTNLLQVNNIALAMETLGCTADMTIYKDVSLVDLSSIIHDTFTHKLYFLTSCLLFTELVITMGLPEIIYLTDLVNRAIVHDDSKFSTVELLSLASISSDKSCMFDASSQLSAVKKIAISSHWEKNRHHPEYFSNFNDMTTLDIIEMVIDWHSRSVQHGTSLLYFAKERQLTRFKFSDKIFSTVLYYCNLLAMA